MHFSVICKTFISSITGFRQVPLNLELRADWDSVPNERFIVKRNDVVLGKSSTFPF